MPIHIYDDTSTATTSGAWSSWTSTTTNVTSTSSTAAWGYWWVSAPPRYHDVHSRPQFAHIDAWQAAKRRRARFRSLRLLLSFLSDSQRKQLRKGSFFDVVGGNTGDIYRIYWQKYDSMVANIRVMDKNNLSYTKKVICAHLATGFLIGDQLLAQKMLIEQDEIKLLKVSNIHPLSTRPAPALVKKAA